ncbi:hypothetical protein ACIB24_00450 [Spongisporangium articulatum]|uniref:Uncharacterized protein n=1 Tax=Spongisporangium articulatum TaxID=3362603 RepID=A0ABW8AGN9_9ACTN
MADEELEETQWTTPARAAYVVAVEAAVQALRAHAERVHEREGKADELGAYFESTEELRAALDGLSEAEFDLTGSFPFVLTGYDEDDEGEFEDFDGDDLGTELDGEEPVESFLTVEYRAQFAVVDREGLLRAGREAYREAWPDAGDEDAETEVPAVTNAVGELLHVHGLAALDADVDYLEPRWHEVSVSESDEEIDPDEE